MTAVINGGNAEKRVFKQLVCSRTKTELSSKKPKMIELSFNDAFTSCQSKEAVLSLVGESDDQRD